MDGIKFTLNPAIDDFDDIAGLKPVDRISTSLSMYSPALVVMPFAAYFKVGREFLPQGGVFHRSFHVLLID